MILPASKNTLSCRECFLTDFTKPVKRGDGGVHRANAPSTVCRTIAVQHRSSPGRMGIVSECVPRLQCTDVQAHLHIFDN